MSVRISDLLQVTITIEPVRLERLLDALAELPHAIAAELRHGAAQTEVCFPVYRNWMSDLHGVLAEFAGARLRYVPVLDGLRG